MPSIILPLTREQAAFLLEIARELRGSEAEIATDWGRSYRQILQDPADHEIPTERFREQVQLFLTSFSDGDFERYFERIAKAGLELARNRIPYENLILSFHLYEDAAASHLRRLFPGRFGEAISVLDHLYHNVIAILARSYFAELEREREKVIHIVAHDLRIPLTGILLASQAISRRELTQEKQREFAAMITDAGKSMAELIERMLEYGKLRSGKMTPRFQDIDLLKVALETARFHLPAAAERRISLTLNDASPEDWGNLSPIWMRADRQMIGRAISNYLSNAIKHATSFVSVRIRDENDAVTISVHDDGRGIPGDQLCLVFEDYYVSPGNKSGTGLGLPSVRMIAELHGGKYDVHSAPGQGSTFILELPRRLARTRSA